MLSEPQNNQEWYSNKDLASTGVYKITNILNGKIYIGSTGVSFKIRWSNHRSELNNNKHINPHLQAAFNKCGKDNFVFEILEFCEDKHAVGICEQKWIDKLGPTNPMTGYNMCANAKSVLGIRRSAETRSKISKSNMGKKYSEEQRKRMSEGQKLLYKSLGKDHWMFGRHVSSETRAKLSASHMGLSRGEKNSKSKLTEASVKVIYCLLFNSSFSQKEIAQRYNVSRETISGIKTGRLWGWFTTQLNIDDRRHVS